MGNIKKHLERIIEYELFFPSHIIIRIATIAYLPFINLLEFYRDDYYAIWATTTGEIGWIWSTR